MNDTKHPLGCEFHSEKAEIIHKSLTQQKSIHIYIHIQKYVQLGISCARVGTQTGHHFHLSRIKIDPHNAPWYKSPILRSPLLPTVHHASLIQIPALP